MDSACPRSCGGCDEWDWLYALGLGALHHTLQCWRRPPHGAKHVDCSKMDRSGWPTAHAVASRAELRVLPTPAKAWLRQLARSLRAAEALEAAFDLAPPPAAASARGPSTRPPPPPPPPSAPPPSRPTALPPPKLHSDRQLEAQREAERKRGSQPPPLPPAAMPRRIFRTPAGSTGHDEL